MVDPAPIKSTLEKVSRLYELTAEMRQIVQELHEVNVRVEIGRHSAYGGDPLDAVASIGVFLRPGCDLTPR